MVGREYLHELAAAVRAENGGAGLALIDRLYNASKDMERLCAELIDYFRGLMIVKSVEKGGGADRGPPAEIQRMRPGGGSLYPAGHSSLHGRAAAVAGPAAGRRFPPGGDGNGGAQTLYPELDVSPESMLRRLKSLEDAVRSGQALSPAAPAPALSQAAQAAPAVSSAEDAPPPPWADQSAAV